MDLILMGLNAEKKYLKNLIKYWKIRIIVMVSYLCKVLREALDLDWVLI
jgi:hypothetical protein